MSFHKIYRRADIALHARQGPAAGSNTVSTAPATTSSTTRPLPAAALTTSVPPHGVNPSASSSSTSSSGSSSSSSGSSSSSSSASSVAPNPASVAQSATEVSTRSTPAVTSTHTTSRATTTRSVATATNTSGDSDGMGVGSIAGIAVAAIVGIAVISAFVVWLIRRKKKNRDIDEEPFNRNSFMRNSTVIPDDDVGIPSRTRPQPNMAERQPTYGAAPSFNDPGYNSFGYNTQPSYGAPQPGFNPSPFGPGGAPATPLPHSPGYGNTYDQGFNQQAGYTELTRGGPHDYPPSPHTFDQQFPPPSPSYVGHDKFPTPPPAANYPEANPAPGSAPAPGQQGYAPVQPRQPNGAAAPGQQAKGRPDTVYDTEDAYGGM